MWIGGLLENDMKIESIERPGGYLEKKFLKNWVPRFFLYHTNLLG
jgi:hypothetical protein